LVANTHLVKRLNLNFVPKALREDFRQVLLLAVWKATEKYDGRGNFPHYANRWLELECKNYRKKLKRKIRFVNVSEEDEEGIFERKLVTMPDESCGEHANYCRGLTDLEKKVLICRLCMSRKQMAVVFRCGIRAIDGRMQRIRRKVAKNVADYEGRTE
jgi:DNA-directed RNA polymerase specialized sigma24 family protein